ncbi:MAG: TetR/AcrR family transcriptional regulator [Syntrophales bacterium]|jgi:TetR/AcrR family fatty acid metabolism transcriptional regulator|nr:TetR/AcrR family transcriptional regulator [Syntrophales bacterium]MDY0044309.1 TetR/AcrR family transcriptional regulator [Syntrophales bacterium]
MANENRVAHKKDKILNAALRIFAAKGYHNSTISEICKEAGYSEAAIYEHFGSKEDLFFAIPEKKSEELLELLKEVIPLIKSVEERMRMYVRAYIRLYRSNPDYSALCLLQLVSFKNFHQTKAYTMIRRGRRIFREWVSEGIQNGTFRQDLDPHLVSAIIFGLIDALFIDWHLKGMPKDPEISDILDPMIDMIFDSLRVKKENESKYYLMVNHIPEISDFLQHKEETAAHSIRNARRKNAGGRKLPSQK